MESDKDVTRIWAQSAPYWEKYREMLREMFLPITKALIEEAQIVPGYSTLDVATGPGEPALGIAEVVGATGEVVGIDPVPAMTTVPGRPGTPASSAISASLTTKSFRPAPTRSIGWNTSSPSKREYGAEFHV